MPVKGPEARRDGWHLRRPRELYFIGPAWLSFAYGVAFTGNPQPRWLAEGRGFAVDQGQEEVVTVDIGVAAIGANPNEIYSKPIG
jgi:hypothetical protein